MYRIEINDNQRAGYIKMISSNSDSSARIQLNQGASLQELFLNKFSIIKDLKPLTYDNTYASAILFPFANRIKDGQYVFQNKTYRLDINQREENNALHGLVYNKTFDLVKREVSENHASVQLIYKENHETKGFPFTYTIQLDYLLMDDSLQLRVSVKNTDTKPFPFTLGWHPYFYNTDLSKCSLLFDSSKKISFGERMITDKIVDFKNDGDFKIENQKLDDCFILKNNKVAFKTPSYNFELSSSAEENFLQVYTPDKDNTIAIEPTTGVSDSFNNAIGLQVLDPDKSYSIVWKIKMFKSS